MMQELAKVIDNFKSRKILVLGDMMVDENVYGKANRISPEAPIPVVRVEKKEYRLGGAANVMTNILSLGGEVFGIGVVGTDYTSKILNELLEEKGIKFYLVAENSRPTTKKTRILARSQGGYHPIACRIDEEIDFPIEEKTAKKIIEYVKGIIDEIDCIILSDYNKGVLNNSLSTRIIQLANEKNKPVLVDPKPENISFFKNCTAITPNKEEASKITGIKYNGTKDLEKIGKALFEMLNPKYVIVTCGEDGIFIYNKEGTQLVPTKAIEVIDVTGAGDTVIATLALGLSSGVPVHDAAVIANYAAGVVIAKVGTATLTQEELKEYIITHPHNK